MQPTVLETRIRTAIEASLQAMGYAVVRVKMRDGGRKALEIMAERADDVPMTVEDCEQISRHVSALLDVEDPITGAYDLEVMSPGLDRPLMSLADFARFNGQQAKVETLLPIGGQRRFKGIISGVEGDEVILTLENGTEIRISCSGIRSAKLSPQQDQLFKKKPVLVKE